MRRAAMLLATLAVVSALVVTATASAQAAVRSGSATFAAPHYPTPSLEPRPPITQSDLYPERVSVSYDTGGVITVRYRNYDAAFWGEERPQVGFSLYSDCEGDDSVVSGSMYGPGEGGGINAGRAGYDGRVAGTVSFDGSTFTGSIAHAGLAGLDLRCVGITVDVPYDPGNQSDGSAFFYFDGFQPAAPPKPTPARKVADTKPTYLLAAPYHWSKGTHRRVRPKRFGLWGDSMAESGHYLKMRWSRWDRSVAIGHGKAVALHAEHKKGRWVFTRARMRLKLSRPVLCGRSWVFSRITYRSKYGTFRRAIPNGCRR